MKLLHLHSNNTPVTINAENIVMFCFNAENGKVNLITNYIKATRLEVDESLYQIDNMINLGEYDENNKGSAGEATGCS